MVLLSGFFLVRSRQRQEHRLPPPPPPPSTSPSNRSGKRLRHNVADLFLSNSVSATRAASLFCDAAAAGAVGVGDLQRGRSSKTSSSQLAEETAQRVEVAERTRGSGISAFLASTRDCDCFSPRSSWVLVRATRNGPHRCCTRGHDHSVHGHHGTRGGARAVG